MKSVIKNIEELAKEESNNGIIAKYLLIIENPETIKLETIAKDCFVSNATVSRFAKLVGASTFSEIKYILSDKKIMNYGSTSVERDSFLMEITSSFVNTFDTMNSDNLNKLIWDLENHDKIILYAVGGTHIVARDFMYKIRRIGLNVIYDEDSHYQKVYAMNAEENTLCIAISYSGTTETIINLLNISKKQKAKTYLISSNHKKVEDADHQITISKEESIYRYYSITSTMTLLLVTNFIFTKLINKDNSKYLKALKDTTLK